MPAGPINTIGEMFADPQIGRAACGSSSRRPRHHLALGARADRAFAKRRLPTRAFAPPWRAYGRNPGRTGERRKHEDRRTTDRRGPEGERRRARFLRAGRKLSRRARRALRLADPHHRLPAGRRRGDDGRCQGKLTGKPGICFVTRGPGATNASAGIHIAMQDSIADDPVHRPDRARHARARGLAGSRLPALLRRHRQMGGRNRRCGAHSRDRHPRLHRRDVRPAGPGRDRAAGGHADGAGRGARGRHYTPVATPPGGAEMAELESLLGNAKRPFAIVGGTRWSERVGRGLPAAAEALGAAGGLSRSAARCCSIICIPTMQATSASA